MSSTRVTQGIMVNQALADLNFQTRRLLQLQKQLATGQKVNAPSDDPLAARRAVNLRASIAKSEQYLSTISSAGPQLAESTTALQSSVSIVQRARELVLEGANGTVSQLQMNQIATEVDQLIEGMLAEANHQTNNRYIFGGTRSLNQPFLATRDGDGKITSVSYEGNSESVAISVGDGISLEVNEPGSRAFQSSQDVFQTLIDIRDNLQAGDKDSLQARLTELSSAQDQLLLSQASLGAIQNRAETLTASTEDYVQQLQVALSDNVDADYAETVINLNAQSNAFQAALNATARVIQPSLLDFI